MRFQVGDRVQRVRGSVQKGTVMYIYDEDLVFINAEGNRRLAAGQGDLAVHFDGASEGALIPLEPSQLKRAE